MNIEHRTPNIERRILMTLRFIHFKPSEPQNFEGYARACVASLAKQVCPAFFLKMTGYIIQRWTFDVRCSMFIFSAISAQS